MKKLSNLLKNDKGFTLVEIIVVLAILAILIAVALPSMSEVVENSKGKVILQDARAAKTAIEFVAMDVKPAAITKTKFLELIDKKGASGIRAAVACDADGKLIMFVYADETKVRDKAVLIVSEGKETDIATVYDTFELAVAAGGDKCNEII